MGAHAYAGVGACGRGRRERVHMRSSSGRSVDPSRANANPGRCLPGGTQAQPERGTSRTTAPLYGAPTVVPLRARVCGRAGKLMNVGANGGRHRGQPAGAQPDCVRHGVPLPERALILRCGAALPLRPETRLIVPVPRPASSRAGGKGLRTGTSHAALHKPAGAPRHTSSNCSCVTCR